MNEKCKFKCQSSNVKLNLKTKYQNFLALNFDIHLAFELWHLTFWVC